MAKYASLSGESFGVDDTRLKWSFLKGEREKGRKREGGREGREGIKPQRKGEEDWTSKLTHELIVSPLQ